MGRTAAAAAVGILDTGAALSTLAFGGTLALGIAAGAEDTELDAGSWVAAFASAVAFAAAAIIASAIRCAAATASTLARAGGAVVESATADVADDPSLFDLVAAAVAANSTSTAKPDDDDGDGRRRDGVGESICAGVAAANVSAFNLAVSATAAPSAPAVGADDDGRR